jgi:hypothetical protein
MPLKKRLPGDMGDVVEFGEVDELGEGAKSGFTGGEVLDMLLYVQRCIWKQDTTRGEIVNSKATN